MGKTFIADETNDQNTADVTSTGMLPQDKYSSAYLAGAATATLSWAISGVTSCYLHSIIISSFPATATILTLVDASSTGGTTSTGTSGRVARIDISPASCATSLGSLGGTIPIDIFFSKGLSYYLSAGDAASAGVIFVYRTT